MKGQGGDQVGDYIPFEYDYSIVDAYYKKRPWLVANRIKEVLAASNGLVLDMVFDTISKESVIEEENIAKKKDIANQIKDLAVVLGPAFIKLG